MCEKIFYLTKNPLVFLQKHGMFIGETIYEKFDIQKVENCKFITNRIEQRANFGGCNYRLTNFQGRLLYCKPLFGV